VTGILPLDKAIEDSRYPAATHPITPYHFTSDIDLDTVGSVHGFDAADDHDGPHSPVHDLGPPITDPKPLIINISLSKPGVHSAATHLLNQLTSASTLPRTHGGKEGLVVWIDLSNTFDIKALYRHILSHLKSKSPTRHQKPTRQPPTADQTNRPDNIDSLAREVLQHIHIIRCISTHHLLTTLHTLPTYLLNPTEHKSTNRALNLLIITSINHFHWTDRFDHEITRLSNPTATTSTTRTQEQNLTTQILNELKSLYQRFKCSVLYTSTPHAPFPPPRPQVPGTSSITNTTTPTQQQPTSSSVPALIPQNESPRHNDPFQSSALITLTPTSATINIPRFAPSMTVDECLRDKGKREKAVRLSAGRWWVDVRGGGLMGVDASTGTGTGTRGGVGRERRGFGMEISPQDEGLMFE